MTCLQTWWRPVLQSMQHGPLVALKCLMAEAISMQGHTATLMMLTSLQLPTACTRQWRQSQQQHTGRPLCRPTDMTHACTSCAVLLELLLKLLACQAL